MLKYFILALLCLILYQLFYQVIEGLEGESQENSTEGSGTDATTTSTSTSSTNNNNCSLSLTDRNVFLLNDRVNALQVQYTDLCGNMMILNKQMEDLMKQNENAASDLVGNEPLDISTGGNDMPQELGTDDVTPTTPATESSPTS